MRGRILLIEDDADLGETLAKGLGHRGFAVTWQPSAEQGLALLEDRDFDVVITDLHLDGMDGFDFCARVVQNRPGLPVVMITAFGSMDSAVAAIRVGAYDFITKPFELELLVLTVARAVQHRALGEEVKRLRQEIGIVGGWDRMIGSSPGMQKIKALIDRVAESEATLLIMGESGTGKELVARAVHQRGRSSTGPFVAINCAAMPETLLESELFGHRKGAFTDARTSRPGLFVKAEGGTLFLDEIGEMPLTMQPKLLRALQERTVRPIGGEQELAFHARIITASNRDLEHDVEERLFREDLFYRINVLRIDVPPLRGRRDDVLFLAQHFLKQFSLQTGKNVTGISTGVAEKLVSYRWPGNVRELQNCIERAVAFARFEDLTVDDLPERVRDHQASDGGVPGLTGSEMPTMEEVERRYVLRVLKQVEGNKTAASDVLGIARRTLHRKLVRWGHAQASDEGEL